MSLASFLKVRDVGQTFMQEFEKPRLGQKRELLAAPLTKNYSPVGTAFDYLLRFYLKRLNPRARTRRCIAEQGLGDLESKPKLYKAASSLMQQAKANYAAYIKSGQLSDDLIGSAIFLAKMDSIFRAGIFHRVFKAGRVASEFRNMFLEKDEQDVADLRRLVSLLQPDGFRAAQICLLNPTFGRASKLVGGADADFVLDDMLVEVKTTKKYELQRGYYNQLLGYYCLHKIGHLDGSPKGYEIRKLGIYYSRFGHLWSVETKDVLNQSHFPGFLKWFKARLLLENR